jgi:hypothetical protein
VVVVVVAAVLVEESCLKDYYDTVCCATNYQPR